MIGKGRDQDSRNPCGKESGREDSLENEVAPPGFQESRLPKVLTTKSPDYQESRFPSPDFHRSRIVSGEPSAPQTSCRAGRGNAARETKLTAQSALRFDVQRVGSISCVTGSRQCRACEASAVLTPASKRKKGPSKPRQEAYLSKRLTRVYSAPVENRMLRDSYIVEE